MATIKPKYKTIVLYHCKNTDFPFEPVAEHMTHSKPTEQMLARWETEHRAETIRELRKYYEAQGKPYPERAAEEDSWCHEFQFVTTRVG